MQKDFDTFSFSPRKKNNPNLIIKQADSTVKPKPIEYRHLADKFHIHPKIQNISQQLEANVKRRIELEHRLKSSQEGINGIKRAQIATQYTPETRDQEGGRKFAKMKAKVHMMEDRVAARERQGRQLELARQTAAILPGTKKLKLINKSPSAEHIQKMKRKLTFPELPQHDLSLLLKECETIAAAHTPHSDTHLLLMIASFHLQKYARVRSEFERILAFKVFDPTAYWIVAEAQFISEHYDSCLRLSSLCMEHLPSNLLPRFVYLQAKCYREENDSLNSLIAYNQLVKMKPKIPEYHLQRGILNDQLGFLREAKQDYAMFSVLKPTAMAYLQQKVLRETSELRKKEYLRILAQMY